MTQAIWGTVQKGQGRGKDFGFPTANIFCDTLSLAAGTRRVNILVGTTLYKGIGPYFPERDLLEIHILDFSGDLYGKEITVFPLKKIRDNQKFDSIDDLVKQIQLDKETALQETITCITFGTFDLFHPGHKAYLRQAKQRGDTLVTIIALDETVKKVKGFLPQHNEQHRYSNVQKSGLVDIVSLGDPIDHYTCLREYKPDVICLGYDQKSFDKDLQTFYTGQGQVLPTLVRLKPYMADTRKTSKLKK